MLNINSKSILFFVWFICHCNLLKAQKIGISISARATYLENQTYDSSQIRGLHFANLISNTSRIIGKFEPSVSYDIGLRTTLFFGKFKIEPELKYCINKTKFNKPNFSNLNSAYTTLNLKNNLIEFNCLVYDYISKKIFFIIGPTMQAIVSSSIENEFRSVSSTNMLGYGLKGGLGIDLTKNISLQVTDQYSKNTFVFVNKKVQGHIPVLTATYWFRIKPSIPL